SGEATFTRRAFRSAAFTESQWRTQVEVALLVDNRIMRVGMSIVAFGQQDSGAQINRLSPELAEKLALDLDVLHKSRIRRHGDRGDRLIQAELDLISRQRIEMELARRAVQISWRAVELLAFPLIEMRPDHVAVSSLEAGVDVHQRLHVVVAGGKLANRL